MTPSIGYSIFGIISESLKLLSKEDIFNMTTLERSFDAIDARSIIVGFFCFLPDSTI